MSTSNTSPLIVPKQQVSDWLLLEELDKLRRYDEQLAAFVARYPEAYEAFEARMTTATTENFVEWDDYLDWQAARAFREATAERISAIRRGEYEVA